MVTETVSNLYGSFYSQFCEKKLKEHDNFSICETEYGGKTTTFMKKMSKTHLPGSDEMAISTEASK